MNDLWDIYLPRMLVELNIIFVYVMRYISLSVSCRVYCQGDLGDTGDMGDTCDTGDMGDTGDTGDMGDMGNMGDTVTWVTRVT